MTDNLNPDYQKKSTAETTQSKEKTNRFPTEVIDLPSKGLVYSKDSILSKGELELRYPTAKDEDILTSQNLIQKGIVIDKFLQSLIITDIDYNDLIIGDKNAVMVASRVLAYGKDYNVKVTCPHCSEDGNYNVDLTTLTDKELNEKIYNRENEYEYTLPHSKIKINFKLLTHADENSISKEIKFKKDFYKKAKISEPPSHELTIRMKRIIIAVNGDREIKEISKFVEDEFLSKDSLEFRKHLNEITPGINMTFDYECQECGGMTAMGIPMTVDFFWPDTTI